MSDPVGENLSAPVRDPAFVAACEGVVGVANVLRGPAETGAYAADFWNQYRGVAGLVVRPRTTAEVAEVVRLAAARSVAIVPQSGNTGLVHGSIPDGTGTQMVLSLSRLDRIRRLDPVGDTIVVEAGCILADVQAAALSVDRLFPISLGAEGSCQIGGNLSTNAGGLNVLRYGMARDLVLGIEAVLADGSVYESLKSLRKDNTGYDLKQLFIGSEGTLGIVTAAVLRLCPPVRERVTVWLSVADPATAVGLFHRFRNAFGDLLSSFELLQSWGVEAAVTHLGPVRPVAEPQPWHVLSEVAWSFADGLRERVDGVLETILADGLCLDGTIAESEQQRLAMWRIREGQSEAARHSGEILRSDVSVAIGDIPALIERASALVPPEHPARLLAFGHVGDGNLHLNYVVPPEEAQALRHVLLGGLYDIVTSLDGSISAEHGVGRAKRDAVLARKSRIELDLMRRLKTVLDPEGLLNPGIVLPSRAGDGPRTSGRP